MFTATECREKANAKIAQAERNIGHRQKRLQRDAEAWLVLAALMEDCPKDSVGGLFRTAPGVQQTARLIPGPK